MGSWDVTTIESKGFSDWRDASIKLLNCPRFYGYINTPIVTEHLTGKIAGVSYYNNMIGLKLNPNYGALDAVKGIMDINQTKGAAQGVGIQIAYGTTAANTLLDLRNTSEKKIPVANSTSTSVTIPLVARYIKTKQKVTPGTADSKITFTINYY